MVIVILPSEFEMKVCGKKELEDLGAKVFSFGMGKVRGIYACHRAVKRIRKMGEPVSHIILGGFCGSLSADLKTGDAVQGNLFYEMDYKNPFDNPERGIERGGERLLPNVKQAIFFCQDKFIEDSKGLWRSVACDMESYAVAYFCQQEKIPFSVIKIVSDVANADAGNEFAKNTVRYGRKMTETLKEAVKNVQK